MTFEYFKKTGEIRDNNGEWDGDEGFWFEYEPEEKDLKEEVVDLLFDIYFNKEIIDSFSTNQRIAIKKTLKNIIDDNRNWEQLYDEFEDELKSIFEEEAFDSLY